MRKKIGRYDIGGVGGGARLHQKLKLKKIWVLNVHQMIVKIAYLKLTASTYQRTQLMSSDRTLYRSEKSICKHTEQPMRRGQHLIGAIFPNVNLKTVVCDYA